MTTASISLNGWFNEQKLNEIKQLKKAHSPTSDILALIKKLTNLVNTQWDTLPSDHKEKLIEFAYSVLDTETSRPTLLSKFEAIWYSLLIIIQGRQKQIVECVEALDILVDEILDKVENDNPQFQEDVLQSATSAYVECQEMGD
ncbi:MAG: hypothetical protein KA717_10125 [Woronichinia naegeliana WA131]|jgi:hypothetical protein|uniref:Uncharacterized protein n=1 Tax=Woronichinia naegeliana WA131 TaxID=2824559 RepID=A0A977PXU1_9CYAN|nr:MAG: hypothetical protein KA717_10125 [Woronichinia naegeliana WA131]